MKKLLIKLGLLMALPFTALQTFAAVPFYDMEAAKANAQADFANWMKYLPDDVFVAHVSIPGTHDTATGFGFCHSYAPLNAGGATYSQTQMARIDEQLAGGVRAFDFRPGVHNGILYCAHGLDITNYTMEQAFTMLTDYLDAHPKEFFVIHFFRGNVGYSGTGMSTSQSDRDNYNKLIDEFFNKGKLNDYIVDYDPRLKVGDIRGKMVLFRRDRIDFANFEKAGNFGDWPSEDEVWNGSSTSVTNASNPSIKGVARVSDMSSPDNTQQIEDKKTAVKNLYEWCSNQPNPNDKKRDDGYYKPDWTITFTSGEYQGVRSGVKAGGRSGYAYCANALNPYYTNLITSSKHKGPCGIIFSDWVLTDYSQDNQYQVYGNELVPAIAYNNFDYIADYILDDEVFDGNEPTYENIWEDGKQYFMRNVGTGNFLSAGLWWGTHGVTAAHGIKVTPEIDTATGKYNLKTTLGANGALDNNYYVDNGGGAGILDLKVTHVGNGKYIFTHADDENIAVGVSELWNDAVRFDGATHNLVTVDANELDPYQQWELISVEEYKQQQLRKATKDNPVDLTFLIPGARFFGNDLENDSWNVNNKNHVQNWGDVGDEDCRRCLIFYSKATSNANWSLSNTVTDLPKGIYTIKWTAYAGTGHNDVTFNVSAGGESYTGGIKNGTVGVTHKSSGGIFGIGATHTYSISDAAKLRQEMRSGEYECMLKDVKITDGKITITASDGAHGSNNSGDFNNSVFVLDDFELIYYGTFYPILDRAIEDAKRRLKPTDDASWLDQYIAIAGTPDDNITDDGAAYAEQIYLKLREITLSQIPDDNKHQDYTNAFINAGFETGTLMGWEASYQDANGGTDTGVKPNDGDYMTKGAQNQFLFNCYPKTEGGKEARGVILSQTIPGLPAGHYVLTAEAANDEGGCIYITANDQKSEALVAEESKTIAKLISFEFDVAENTEEVTISFMGGNADGTFDEFGGNAYKLDDIRLIRSGHADFCAFYKRLQEAMQRMERISAATLPQYYQDKWDDNEYHKRISQIIQAHLDSDHEEGDLGGSNGIKERDELHENFANVILSQNHKGADMSGAIKNFSFEFGELIYWTTKADSEAHAGLTPDKAINNGENAKKDGQYYYYAKHDEGEGDAHAYPIYQSFSGLPVGTYKLTAVVASDQGKKLVLAANGESTEAVMDEGNTFQNVEVNFEITDNSSELTLGLYPINDGDTFVSQEAQKDQKGPWYAVDNFRLYFMGREMEINWTMETKTHGTIILPFAVSADDLAKNGLKVYSVTVHEESNAAGATHHILKYTEKPSIEAHTPYVVEVADATKKLETNAVRAAVKSETPEKGDTYKFKGFTEHEELQYTDKFTNGSLTGTLVETTAEDQQYHLQNYEDNIGFVLHKLGVEHKTFEPYHAYITLPDDDVNIHGLYFEEPTLPLDWEMEGDYYGTIILPFDAEIPAESNMKAYKIQTLDDTKEFYITEEGTQNTYTYQLMHLDEGTTSLIANTPYFVIKDEAMEAMKAAEEAQKPEVTPAAFRLRPLAAEGEEEEEVNPRIVTFKGASAYDKLAYTEGSMTGVHHDTELNDSKVYTVSEDADTKTGYFVSNALDRNDASVTVSANHAYITTSADEPANYMLLVTPESEEPDIETGIDEILAANANVDVYTTGGILLSRDVPAAEALAKLAPGIYILRSGKLTVKVIK